MHSLDKLYEMARLEDKIALASYHANDLASVKPASDRRNGLINLIHAHPDNKHSRRAISSQVIAGVSGGETEGKDGSVVPPYGAHLKHFRVEISRIAAAPDDVTTVGTLGDALSGIAAVFESRIPVSATITRVDFAASKEYETVVLNFSREGIQNGRVE